MVTPQLAIWLSLLALLTVLSIYECLHDALPDAWLSFACIAYAWALMLLATTPEHLLHGFAAGGAGFLLGVLGQAPGVFARGGPSARVGGAGTLAAAAPLPWRALDGRAYLCVGLVVGWPGILVVGAGWLFLVGVVGFYFVATNRLRELLAVSFLPFLTLSALVVFALRVLLLR